MGKPAFPQFLLILFVFVTTGIGISGYFYLRRQLADSRQTAHETLNAIAELKVNQIVRWREECLDDARAVMESHTLAAHLQELLTDPEDIHSKNVILHSMTALHKNLHYARVLLWDQNKQIRFAVPDSIGAFKSVDEEVVAQILYTNQVLLSDLHLDPPVTGQSCIDLYVPLVPIRPAAVGSGAPIGVLQLEIDPAHFLFPLIQSWPTSSRTAETMLLRRDDDSVLYLNELRHRTNTTLRFRLPLTRTDLPAVRAVLGEEGLFEGMDYRDVPVLAALHSVPGSPWCIVAKVDKKEIYAHLRQQAMITGFIVGILFLIALMGTGLFWRQWKIKLLHSEIVVHEQKGALNVQLLEQTERARAALLSILEDQKEAEALLRESEERFKAIASNTPDHILMQDKDLRYTLVINPQLGLTVEQMVGKRDHDFLPAEDADKLVKTKIQVLQTGNPVHLETSLISTVGEVEYFDGTYVPKLDARGRIDGLIGYFRNVTEQKKAEEKIRQSERSLAEAERIGKTGSWDYNVATDTARWSENMFRIFDVDPEMPKELVFKYFVENLVHPDDHSHILSVFQDALAGKRNYDPQYRIVKKNGDIRIIQARAEIVRDSEGIAIRMIGLVSDITERIQAEELLHQTMNRLIETEEQLRREAAQQLHDQVGQNLTALIINLNFFRNQLPGELAKRLDKRLSDSLSLLDDTIDRIRDIMTDLRPSILDDYGLVAALSWSAKKFTERTHIPVSLLGKDLTTRPPLEIEYALYRLTQEALHNVMKHSEATLVEIEVKEEARLVRLSIHDDGVGFDPVRIMQKKDGKGFGLTNITERMKALGGTCEIRSEPGKGTTITLGIKFKTI